jgi:dUTP pyrophosphatase
MNHLPIKIVQLPHAEGLPIPAYASAGAAGLDIRAAVDEPVIVKAGTVQVIPTGLRIAIPEGYEGQIRPRSGLARDRRITIINSPGTIVSDFRGEIMIALYNCSLCDYTVQRGDRIAQLVVTRYERVAWEAVESLPETEREQGGFGSSGRN